jgi:hypothetical protein
VRALWALKPCRECDAEASVKAVITSIALTALSVAPSLAEEVCSQSKLDYFDCYDRKMLGKYVCVYDHIAGIQYKDDKHTGQPFVGGINPNHSKFFMEISRDPTARCDYVGSYVPHDDACKLKYKLTVKGDDEVIPSPAYNGTFIQDFSSSLGLVSIYENGHFNAYFYAPNMYISEGRCEKIGP